VECKLGWDEFAQQAQAHHGQGNPNDECRLTKQIQITNDECSKGVWGIPIWDFGFVSTFGFRASYLLARFSKMKTRLAIALLFFASAIASALPADAHIFGRLRGYRGGGYGASDGQATTTETTSTNGSVANGAASDGTAVPAGGTQMPGIGGYMGPYYDVAWGMPLTVVVPPTVHSQTDYSWGVPSVRVSPITPQFQYQAQAPSSAYRMGQYPPAPPQPSDTQQIGDYYSKAPGKY
jgi:hypothetical protein